jgi:hypothetical protein
MHGKEISYVTLAKRSSVDPLDEVFGGIPDRLANPSPGSVRDYKTRMLHKVWFKRAWAGRSERLRGEPFTQ